MGRKGSDVRWYQLDSSILQPRRPSAFEVFATHLFTSHLLLHVSIELFHWILVQSLGNLVSFLIVKSLARSPQEIHRLTLLFLSPSSLESESSSLDYKMLRFMHIPPFSYTFMSSSPAPSSPSSPSSSPSCPSKIKT